MHFATADMFDVQCLSESQVVISVVSVLLTDNSHSTSFRVGQWLLIVILLRKFE